MNGNLVIGLEGQRTDKQDKAGEGKLLQVEADQLVDNCPQLPKGAKTREIAAKSAGFDSYKTYDRAKSVVEHGTPEIVEAVGTGKGRGRD